MKSDISRSQKVIEFNKKTQTTTSLIFVSRPRCLKGFSAWEEKAIFNFILFLKIRSFDEWVQEIVEVSELCEIRGSGNKNYARNSFFFSVLCKKDFERLDWELRRQVLCWTHGKLQELSCAGETLPNQVNSFLVSQADQSVTIDGDNLHPGLRRHMNILRVTTNKFRDAWSPAGLPFTYTGSTLAIQYEAFRQVHAHGSRSNPRSDS